MIGMRSFKTIPFNPPLYFLKKTTWKRKNDFWIDFAVNQRINLSQRNCINLCERYSLYFIQFVSFVLCYKFLKELHVFPVTSTSSESKNNVLNLSEKHSFFKSLITREFLSTFWEYPPYVSSFYCSEYHTWYRQTFYTQIWKSNIWER